MSRLMCFEWFGWALCAGTLTHMYPLPPPSPSIMYNPHLSNKVLPSSFRDRCAGKRAFGEEVPSLSPQVR